jgi:L-threonylcarbamoyladenylate synthase
VIETLPLHHLTRVVSLLAHGQLVAYPTGTSYGLAVNALDRSALEKLSALKHRPKEKSYTVLLPRGDPDRYVAWTADERRAFTTLADQPVTLLVRGKEPPVHPARDRRIGVRTRDHPFPRELVALLSFPITATSANVDDQPPARSPAEVETLSGTVRLFVVDGGRLPPRLPSTIAAFANRRWEISRKGDVTPAVLQEVVTAATAPGVPP